MTQEEAIKILSDVHDKALFSVRNALETLIPELAENEDERIRKAIICGMNALKGQKMETFAGIPINDCLAWLKKQKEQKPAEWSEEDEEALDMCLDAIPTRWKTKSGILLTKWLKDNIHPHPKQEWSEEDKKMLDAIIDMVSNSLYEPLCPREGMLAWLKSLPQRFSLSSWGEEIRDGFFGKFNHDSWKPSEEQMEALKHYVDTTIDGEIELLYNDLKKLM